VGYANVGETGLHVLRNGCRKKCKCGLKVLNWGVRKVQLQCPKQCYDPSPPQVGCKYLKSGRVISVKAGESYYDGCNNCRCGKSGQSGCTRKACPTKCMYKHWGGVVGYANVGETGLHVLRNGCRKKCKCGLKVLNWGVRKVQLQCPKQCYDPSPPQVGCKYLKSGRVISVKAGESYYDGCNNCRCGKRGQGWCTMKACPTKCMYKHWGGVVGYANVGESGLQVLQNGCRKKCNCGFKVLNKGFRKVQLQCPKRCYDPLPPVVGCKYLKSGRVKIAKAGRSYNNGCNNCLCGKRGQGWCTMKACRSKCMYKHWSGVVGYANTGETVLKVLIKDCRKKCKCGIKVTYKGRIKTKLHCAKRCYGKYKKSMGKRKKRKSRGKKHNSWRNKRKSKRKDKGKNPKGKGKKSIGEGKKN